MPEQRHLTILGCGFSAKAFVSDFGADFTSIAGTSRSPERLAAACPGLAAFPFDGRRGEAPLIDRLGQTTHLVVSIAPDAEGDIALRVLGAALATAPLRQVIYLSTIGVYGDHQGAWVDEAAPLRAGAPRGRWRIGAEAAWWAFGAARAIPVTSLRLAGIYGPGRNVLLDLRTGEARRIIKPGQVFNRIHAEDIAGAIAATFATPLPAPAYNVADDEPCAPQIVVEHAAALLGMAPPPEIPFETAALSPMARSFYGEVKRVSNAALKRDTGWRPRYPSFREGLAALLAAGEGR